MNEVTKKALDDVYAGRGLTRYKTTKQIEDSMKNYSPLFVILSAVSCIILTILVSLSDASVLSISRSNGSFLIGIEIGILFGLIFYLISLGFEYYE